MCCTLVRWGDKDNERSSPGFQDVSQDPASFGPLPGAASAVLRYQKSAGPLENKRILSCEAA